jgi:hypothetical protein
MPPRATLPRNDDPLRRDSAWAPGRAVGRFGSVPTGAFTPGLWRTELVGFTRRWAPAKLEALVPKTKTPAATAVESQHGVRVRM